MTDTVKGRRPSAASLFYFGEGGGAMAAAERLAVLNERLEMYRRAEAAILSSQSYEMEGLKLTRANLADVQKQISRLEGEIARLSRVRGRLRVIVPKDW